MQAIQAVRLATFATLLMTTQATTAQSVSLFFENFESLAPSLGPVVTFDSEIRNPAAWTETPPAGWTVDDTGVLTTGDANSGVVEFEGWSFVDSQWWVETAGDQDRSQFLGGNGVVAVADPDEWDDFGSPDPESFGPYDAKLLTPMIDLTGAPAGEDVKIAFNSSWRPEDTQKASLTATYNTGEVVELFLWDSRQRVNGEENPAFKDDAVNENVLIPLTGDYAIPTGATDVQLEFRVFDAANDWWWAFDNLSVFTGDNPPVGGLLRLEVDRDTGNVKMINDTEGSVQLRGYSIVSTDGVFDEAAASFQAPADNWLRATRFDDESNDLSEVNLDYDTIGPGEEIDLGQVRQDYFREAGDLDFQYLIEGRDQPVSGAIEFVGTREEAYDFLDLNYDGVIDLLDWLEFKAGFGKDLSDLTTAQRYNAGDLDFDGRHTPLDYLAFKSTYNTVNGSGAFAAMLAVPEPGCLSLLAVGGVLLSFGRRLGKNAACLLLAVAATAGLGGAAQAQQTIFSEDFEGVALADPIEENTEGDEVVSLFGPAGWVTTNQIPGVPTMIDQTYLDPYFDEIEDNEPQDNGVVDFAGWSFMNRDWWVSVAGQDRGQFTRATGTIMVADSDEWDDSANLVDPADINQLYNTFIETPTISIPAGIPAGRLQLSFDSSWRDEFDDPANQSAEIKVYYDGDTTGSSILNWESDPEGDNFKDDSTNERVNLDLQYDGVATELKLEFLYTLGNNDWWWAIDNLLVSVPSNPLQLRVNTANGRAYLSGDDVIPTDINYFEVRSENGVLTADTAYGLSGSVADDGDGTNLGEQWELLTDEQTADQLFAEAYLFGDTMFDDTTEYDLGYLMDPSTAAGERDLTFTYVLATGDVIEIAAEDVVYFSDPSDTALPGDYNGDGSVDAADYVVYRNNLGATYNEAHLNLWKANYGRTASAVSVPEPTGIAALLVGLGAAFSLRSRRALRAAPAAAVCLAAVASVAEAKTNDREYLFGDADTGAAAGAFVGSGTSNGATFDSEGVAGQNQLIDLLPEGPNTFAKPRYVSITDRPDGVSGLGIALNPFPAGSTFNEQFLTTGFGEALNYPERSPSSTFSQGGSIDYDIISDRGFQLWVKPTAIAESHIVMDTNQHGVLINEDGEFAMRYAYDGRAVEERRQLLGGLYEDYDDMFDYASGVTAEANTWYHLSVVRPFGPGNGSILYVDGVAVAAAKGEYFVEEVVNDEVSGDPVLSELDTSPLVIGANTGNLNAGDDNPAYLTSRAGTDKYFSGVVDDLEMFVMGLNGSGYYGEHVFEDDNGYAAAFKPTTAGDLNGDDSVDVTDAQLFADNWLFTKVLEWTDPDGAEQSLVVGDLETRGRGDFNYDGRVNLEDWAILNNASPLTASLAMVAIQGGVIPEPTGVCLAAAALAGLATRGRRSPQNA